MLGLLMSACAVGELPEQPGDFGGGGRSDMTTVPDMALPVYDFGGYDLSGPRGEDMGFVLTGCDVLGQNCATQRDTPHKCVFDLKWAPLCMPTGVERGVGEACDGIQECAVGAVCVSWGDDRGTRCEQTCPLNLTGGCDAGERCANSLPGQTEVGLCIEDALRCEIVRQTCDEGDCVLKRHPDTGQLDQLCGQAGQTREGERCTGHSACAAGMICVRVAEATEAQCVRVCNPPRPGEITSCRDGKTCVGETSESGLRYCL